MSATIAVAIPEPIDTGQLEHYLNARYGLKSWLLTTDHKRIALLYLASITAMFFVGGAFAVLMRLNLLTPEGDLVSTGDLQQAVHHARRDHGLLLPDPVDSRGARKFPAAADDRRARCGLSTLEPAELVHLHHWARTLALISAIVRRRGYRLDVLHALQHDLLEHSRDADGHRRLHRRLLLDPDRPEFHRHHSQHARAGPDLVPAAAVSLVALRDEPDLRPGDAGAGHHPAAAGCGAVLRRRHLRSRTRRRSAAVPAPVLVLLASGRLHHDPAGDGRRQRDHPLLLAQADFRLQLRRVLEHGHRGHRLPRLGTSHVRQPASRSMPAWSSRF